MLYLCAYCCIFAFCRRRIISYMMVGSQCHISCIIAVQHGNVEDREFFLNCSSKKIKHVQRRYNSTCEQFTLCFVGNSFLILVRIERPVTFIKVHCMLNRKSLCALKVKCIKKALLFPNFLDIYQI